MAKEVFLKMDADTLPGRFAWPTLWHTDLHLGNIYVSDEDPTQVVSLIDWQSIVVAPLFYQVRFPELITIGEDYELGNEVPTLPENIDEMDEDDQAIVRFKHKQTMMGKGYEAASGFKNKNVLRALRLHPVFRQLFLRCGEVCEEGIVPLRTCLIRIAELWTDTGFSGDCPFNFTEDEIENYQHEFQEYHDHRKFYELVRELLDTDADGWVAPDVDFEEMQKHNKELFEMFIAHGADYGKSAEEMQKVWPY